LAMCDEDVVRKFHARVGIGTIGEPRRHGGPRVDGGLRKLAWEWRIGAQEDVLNLCALLAPLMGTRRANKMTECFSDLVR
jgi:hypothetical protein